jgi:hypothetical protein
MDDERLEPGARRRRHVTLVKRPGVVASELSGLLDQREAGRGLSGAESEGNERVLEPSPDENVVEPQTVFSPRGL